MMKAYGGNDVAYDSQESMNQSQNEDVTLYRGMQALIQTINVDGNVYGNYYTYPQPGTGQMFTLSGEALTASPMLSASGSTLYLQEQGDGSTISVDDIHQGYIGDCYLLASIGELACVDSSKIRNIIHDNGNGTETVTLYAGRNGKAPDFGTTTLTKVEITVDNVFPSNAANCSGQDRVGNQQEIWVQVLEKAIATEDGGYGAISNGGWPMFVMEQLTGKLATEINPATVTPLTLNNLVHDGSMMVFDTAYGGNLSFGLINSHSYIFEGLETVNGVSCVKLGNPWGYAQPAAIPVTKLSQVFSQIDVCHT